MPKPLLPPRGLFVPAKLIFDKDLPAAARDTAIQLRALAWGQLETPPLSLTQLEEITDKSQSTLYGHMRLLRLRGALRWRSAGTSEIIVTFDPAYWLSENLESGGPAVDTEPAKTADENGTFQLSKKLEKPVKELPASDKSKTKNPKSTAFQNSGKPEKPPAVDYYPLAQALAEVCHMDLKVNRGRLFAEAKLLAAATPAPTPDLLKQHYNGNPRSFWRAQDWRGKQGQDPSPANIRETWGKWQLSGAPKSNVQVSTDAGGVQKVILTPEQLAIKAQMQARRQAERTNANR